MNKNVIVTGVTRGIGRETAIKLAEEGYFVIGFYKSSEQKAKELESISQMIKTYQCDVSDYNCVLETAKNVLKEYNCIYGIVNNAGISKTSLFTDVTEDDFDRIFETNVKGVFAVTKAFLPSMINKKQGKIVNVSSIWGIHGGSCEVVYSASKGAIIAMTKALAREVGPSGINVNCVAPGVVETDMINNLSDDDKALLAEDTALMRNGNTVDIANTISFLLSEKADFITGQVITVDGGLI